MDDKMLENALQAALKAPEMPSGLNDRLAEKIGKSQKRSAAVFSITKKCASCAAIFLCALTVLSNSGGEMRSLLQRIPVIGSVSERLSFKQSEEAAPDTAAKKSPAPEDEVKKTAPEAVADGGAAEEDNAPLTESALPPVGDEAAEKTQQPKQPQQPKKTQTEKQAVQPKYTESEPQPKYDKAAAEQSVSAAADATNIERSEAEQSTDGAYSAGGAAAEVEDNSPVAAFSLSSAPDNAEECVLASGGGSSARADTSGGGGGMRSKSAYPTLAALFEDGYDYISAANGKIRSLLPEGAQFGGITGDEEFRISENGELILTLADGAESREFNLGRIENGRFAE